jgi:hypothetical protein
MSNSVQFEMISVGVLLGQADATLDMERFDDLEDLKVFLNGKYSTDIKTGMLWPEVLEEVKTALANKRYNDAMGSI